MIRKNVKGEGETHRVRMQHVEEVWAAQKLCAGGLEQQRETRPRAGVTHCALSPVLYNRQNTNC